MHYIQTRKAGDVSNYYAIFNVDLKKIAELYQNADRVNTETTDLLKEPDYHGLSWMINICFQLQNKLKELTKQEAKFVQDYYVRRIEGDGGQDKYEIYKKIQLPLLPLDKPK